MQCKQKGGLGQGETQKLCSSSVALFSLWKHEATVKAHTRRQNNHREEGANECCYKLRNG